jgi:hypothetical protein
MGDLVGVRVRDGDFVLLFVAEGDTLFVLVTLGVAMRRRNNKVTYRRSDKTLEHTVNRHGASDSYPLRLMASSKSLWQSSPKYSSTQGMDA